VKHLKIAGIASALALVLGAGTASADIVVNGSGVAVVVDQGGATQNSWVGSDTLNKVISAVVPTLGLAQITSYVDQGSGQGQRQLEGSPKSGTSEPACTVGSASDANGYNETNPGCQEIAPMSRQMDKDICEDDITDPGGDDTSVKNTSGESLAVCGDAIVVITDNASHRAYADDAVAGSCPASGTSSDNTSTFTPNAAYSKTGKLRRSGTFNVEGGASGETYQVGANGMGWKDVLRLVYTGCKNRRTPWTRARSRPAPRPRRAPPAPAATVVCARPTGATTAPERPLHSCRSSASTPASCSAARSSRSSVSTRRWCRSRMSR
jgi:hypothetical protein